jgi:hypothetical protein
MKLGNATVRMRSWTADSENIFATQIATDSGSPDLTLQLNLAMPVPDSVPHTILPAAAGTHDGVLWTSRENDLTGTKEYKSRVAVAVRLVGASFTKIEPVPTNAAGSFILKAGKSVWVVAVFVSDSRIGSSGPGSDALVQFALEHSRKLSRTSIAQSEMKHREWWERFGSSHSFKCMTKCWKGGWPGSRADIDRLLHLSAIPSDGLRSPPNRNM